MINISHLNGQGYPSEIIDPILCKHFIEQYFLNLETKGYYNIPELSSMKYLYYDPKYCDYFRPKSGICTIGQKDFVLIYDQSVNDFFINHPSEILIVIFLIGKDFDEIDFYFLTASFYTGKGNHHFHSWKYQVTFDTKTLEPMGETMIETGF